MSFWECPNCGAIPGITVCCTDRSMRETKPAVQIKQYRIEVDAGALQMVINALRRDAADGKLVRGEMADELERTMVRLP